MSVLFLSGAAACTSSKGVYTSSLKYGVLSGLAEKAFTTILGVLGTGTGLLVGFFGGSLEAFRGYTRILWGLRFTLWV